MRTSAGTSRIPLLPARSYLVLIRRHFSPGIARRPTPLNCTSTGDRRILLGGIGGQSV